MKHLVLQTYAVLQAWGDIAPGEVRPTYTHPSKSGILGLIAACLGIDRDDHWHERAATGYGMAVLVRRPGEVLRDYHTIQTAPGTKSFVCRHDQVNVEDPYPRESERFYIQDGYFVVALWEREGPVGGRTLEDLVKALREPHWTPHLGRKACPPALPFHPVVVDASTLADALKGYPEEALLTTKAKSFTALWEDHPSSGMRADQRTVRRDELSSRARWQFRERQEFIGSLGR